MHKIIIDYPLMATPRQRHNTRTGRSYKPPEYILYTKKLTATIKDQMYTPVIGSYYLGLFNGYIPRSTRFDSSDIDNILKGILDTLVHCKKLRGDNRTSWVGTKVRSYILPYDFNVVLIGSEHEERDIDEKIMLYKSTAVLGMQLK